MTPRMTFLRQAGEKDTKLSLGGADSRNRPLPCPALLLPCCPDALLPFAAFSAVTVCEGRIVCWKPLLLVERPAQAQAARTHNPTPIHLSGALNGNVVILCRISRGSREQETPPRGGLGGEPKTLIENSWGGWGGTTC